jgi:Recombinase
MKRVDGGVSSSDRGRGSSLAIQLAADSFARNVLPTIQTLTAAGFVSQRALANELNRRRIPTARGGSWHYMTVRRVLFRLGLVAPGRTSTQAADARAEALASTIRNFRNAAFSLEAIARELNERKIPSPRGAKWHRTTVTRLLQRLEKLDRASRSRHRR